MISINLNTISTVLETPAADVRNEMRLNDQVEF
jgi:hypothetical protein